MGLAGIALAVPAFSFGSEDDYFTPRAHSSWVSPSVITTTTPFGGLVISAGGYFGSYKSRALEMSEGLIGLAPSDSVYLWYTRQHYLIKGRTSTSRLRLDDNLFGIRAVVVKPRLEGDATVALQVESIQPEDAKLTVGNSASTFDATKNYALSVIYSRGPKADFRLRYGNVDAGNGGHARVFGIGANHQFQPIGRLESYAQLDLIGQNWKSSATGKTKSFDIKAGLNLGASYHLLKWLKLQGDVSVYPAGIPMSGGQLAGLGSFLVYEPGGVASGLKSDFVAFGSLRLVAGTSF
jgi:hypothetical protein